jgi:hypothetical protein
MTIKRSRFLLTCLALICFTITTALADEWNKEMVFQFTGPVEVPGKVLQPGKYVFVLADSQSDRNIVQIFSENNDGRREFIATIRAVPDYRLDTPDKPIVLFEERHSDSPEAISSWFYPGDNTGWHFVYPKSERLEVATNTPAPVPAPAPVADQTPASPPPVANEAAEPIPLVIEKETIIAHVEFASEPREDDQISADRELPETAGHSSLLLLAGITILGCGCVAVYLSQRNVRAEAK